MSVKNKQYIYVDHASTTPLFDVALDAMIPLMKEDYGNPSSLHSWSKKPKAALAKARSIIANCIGASPEEIFFTSGGTEANNWVIKGSCGGLLTSAYEHHAILNTVKSEMLSGRAVGYVSPKTDGVVTVAKVKSAWQNGVKLVSIMTANNEIGIVNDIQSLAKFVHQNGALLHTDAVQVVGHLPINVKEMDVDFLSASAHKFNGPKGIGFLYIRKGLSLKNLINGGQQEFGCRAGTENVAAIAGMAAALEWHCNYMSTHIPHLNNLRKHFIEGLLAFYPEARIIDVEGIHSLPGFISVSLPGQSAEGLLHILDLKGIAVSTGAACDSKNTQISHVLKAIKLPKKYAISTLRISFGVENTLDDIVAILNVLNSILNR